MDKQTPDQIMDSHYREWLNDPDRMRTGYDYERTFVEMMRKVEHEVLQFSVGEVPENRNRKKNSRPVLAG